MELEISVVVIFSLIFCAKKEREGENKYSNATPGTHVLCIHGGFGGHVAVRIGRATPLYLWVKHGVNVPPSLPTPPILLAQRTEPIRTPRLLMRVNQISIFAAARHTWPTSFPEDV